MDNYIIVGIVVLIALFAIGTMAMRSGRKGCCGSAGDYTPRKKKLKQVASTRVFRVEGMHCEKCANRVTEAVNDFPGTAGTVVLKNGTLTVSCEGQIPEEQIRAKLQRLGYTLQ